MFLIDYTILLSCYFSAQQAKFFVLTDIQYFTQCTGNDNLHLLTYGKRQRLRIDLIKFGGNPRYVEYDNFVVDSEESQFKLASLGLYSGATGGTYA